MAYSVRTEALPQGHPIAWTIGKLVLAAIVTTGIILVFAASAYLQGTKPPQQPIRSIPVQR